MIVYCRPHVVDRNLAAYKGARLVHLRTVQNKYLDTFVHTFAVGLARGAHHAARRGAVLHRRQLAAVPDHPGGGIPTLINVDGLDSDRRKWPALAKAYLRFAERTAPRWADRAITDSHAVADIFERRYGQRIGVVPYGVEDPGHDGRQALERARARAAAATSCSSAGSSPRTTPTCSSRRSRASTACRARGMKLVIVGGAPYADDYIRQVRRTADPRVVFPGYVFGRRYWELQRHAYLFCAPTEVGGTHPVILEAMAAGNCVLVNDHPPNAETVGDAGIYFSGRDGVSSLSQQLRRLLDDEPLVTEYRERARRRAVEFSWDVVADQYERLLSDVYEAARPGATARVPARARRRVGELSFGSGACAGRAAAVACGDERPRRSRCPW